MIINVIKTNMGYEITIGWVILRISTDHAKELLMKLERAINEII